MALSKVARGIEYGDVSNVSVRNILTGVSRELFGKFTEGDKLYTYEYFDRKCPYTGKDIDINGGYATDHIVPQNKEECGLNVRGNLVFVDKEANSKKGKKSVEEFLLHDQTVLKDVPMEVRQARLQKIRDFQKENDYDPVKIKATLKDYVTNLYEEIKKEQEKRIKHAVSLTGLDPVVVNKITKIKRQTGSKKDNNEVPIILVPSDVEEFKQQLLIKKQARRTLTYITGKPRVSIWKADNFNPSSNLMANIKTSAYYKKRKTEGLLEVKIEII